MSISLPEEYSSLLCHLRLDNARREINESIFIPKMRFPSALRGVPEATYLAGFRVLPRGGQRRQRLVVQCLRVLGVLVHDVELLGGEAVLLGVGRHLGTEV